MFESTLLLREESTFCTVEEQFLWQNFMLIKSAGWWNQWERWRMWRFRDSCWSKQRLSEYLTLDRCISECRLLFLQWTHLQGALLLLSSLNMLPWQQYRNHSINPLFHPRPQRQLLILLRGYRIKVKHSSSLTATTANHHAERRTNSELLRHTLQPEHSWLKELRGGEFSST